MTVIFRAPDGSRHDSGACLSQLNLLAHAQLIELDVGSECGGHGRCGGDRLLTPPGAALSPITEAERRHFSPEELAQGYRLGCQCWPEPALEKSGLDLEVGFGA